MSSKRNRIEFSSKVKQLVAERARYSCSVCKLPTIGPSLESIVSRIHIGVVAHISSASPGGPRYDRSLTSEERASIVNAIYTCQNCGKLIDSDTQSYTVARLKKIKKNHEDEIRDQIGVPPRIKLKSIKVSNEDKSHYIIPKEYAFLKVGDLIEEYRIFISPILQDKGLANDTAIGLLFCTSSNGVEWTLIVGSEWLNWILHGQTSGYKISELIPNAKIYGQIPGWPDSFFEFLQAMVETNTTFEYKRQKGGYLALVQASSLAIVETSLAVK